MSQEITQQKKNVKFPMYACFGNGYDTWEVDILYGKAHKRGASSVQNITTFKSRRKSPNDWCIDIIHANGVMKSRKISTKIRGLGEMSTEKKEKILREIAYCESQVLANAEIKELRKSKPL